MEAAVRADDPRAAHRPHRAELACELATELCPTSHRLVADSHRVRVRNERIRAGVAVRRQQRRSVRSPDGFTIEGLVDDRRSVATWESDQLVCDHELRERCQVIVALGERFSAPGRRR